MEAFKYGCVVEGANFCARPELSSGLSSYIRAGQNVVIQGERRMGKTSLVRETISNMKGYRPIMADFMGVKSIADVCNRIADALARFAGEDSLYHRLMSLLAHLRPIGTIDPMTGFPTITVDARSASSPDSITIAIDALAQAVLKRKVCVVFDEFQDILDVKDGDQVLAIMRSRIQFISKTSFVYLGSARNEMLSIFLSPKSPFYKSAIVFEVGEIPDDDFYKFAVERFSTGSRELTRDMFNRILDFTSRTTGDVQELCDAIWQVSRKGELLTSEHFEKAIKLVFSREGSAYATFIRPLTDIQMRVLKTLARLGGKHPLSGEFLEASRVGTPGSVKRALSSLAKAELVYAYNGEWKFVSPFFKEWLSRLP